MKVSIITVTYNSEKSLQRSIDSVISQDYLDIEHIIIDGGSVDNTIDIINKNKKHIAKYISEKDSGIYQALNKGIRLATGQIIGILNSDDVFADTNIISKVADNFSKNNSDVVYGNLLYVAKNQSENKTVRYWKSNPYNPKFLIFGWMPPHPTLFCKKDIFETYGLYNESLQISSDYDFILRIFKETKLKKSYIPEVMVKMTAGGKSNGSFRNICRKTHEDLRAIRANKVGGIYTLFFKNIRKLKQLIPLYH